MSLAEDLDGIRHRKRGPVPCTTGVWLSGLDDRDRAAFQAFVASGGQLRTLHHTAVRNGCDASETQFRVHCRRRCTCYQGAEVAA